MSCYIEGCAKQPSMQHQHLSGMGAIASLEEKLRNYYNKNYVVLFCNATTALQSLCIALELYKTEIITAPINWGGSIAPFLLHKNKLHFVSYDPDSLNLCKNDLLLSMTTKTKAVLSVDYNGTPVDSKSIKEFCQQNNLSYISDCAQSLGAYIGDKPAGYWADAIVLSFSPGKSLFAGEGGAVVTNEPMIYEKLLWISQHPSKQKTVLGLSNYNEYTPVNGRINPLSAILLSETFDSSLDILKEYQSKCFQMIRFLEKEKLIMPVSCIENPNNSTFFNLLIRMVESINIEQINSFLKENKFPYIANYHTIKIIPFDPIFRKQYRNQFLCSEKLLSQKKFSPLKSQVKLTPIF